MRAQREMFPSVLCRTALSLAVVLLVQFHAQAQTTGEPKPLPAAPDSPPGAARMLYQPYTFSFPGGGPRDLLGAVETMFQHVSFDKLSVPTDANWAEGWQERLRASEKELQGTKVDWLSIADVPQEMLMVRVPKLRFDVNFYVLDGRLGWLRRRASGGDEAMTLLSQVRQNLHNLLTLYNKLGREKPELGQLLVEGDLEKPSVVMLVPDKSATAAQPQIKVKAFSLAGIPEKSLDALQADVRNAQQQAEEYSARAGTGRPIGHGLVSIHAETHLLIATGSEAYVEMVESVVEAYRPKGPQLMDMLKPPSEK
jgi:hypothetical protein